VPAVSVVLQPPEVLQEAVLLCPVEKDKHPVAAAGDGVMVMGIEKKSKLVKVRTTLNGMVSSQLECAGWFAYTVRDSSSRRALPLDLL
jgi:hypothetical protein